jgi:hypothetical protein
VSAADDRYVDAEKTAAWIRYQARRAARARRDPCEYYEFVIREERSNAPLKIFPHQRLMIEFIQAHEKCVVRAPIGFGKTFVVGALAQWNLGTEPTSRIVVLSGTEDQAAKIIGFVRRYIELSGELAVTFPALQASKRKGDAWSQKAIVVGRIAIGIRDASMVALSSHTTRLPGGRYSHFFLDDLLNSDNTKSQHFLEQMRDWVAQNVLDRPDAVGGRICVTNVPWAEKRSSDTFGDITYELELGPARWPSLTMDAFGPVYVRNTDWDTDLIRPAKDPGPDRSRHRLADHDHPRYAAYAGEDAAPGWRDEDEQVPLWPEHYPLERLEKRRVDLQLKPGEFNRVYRCMPRDEKSSHVKIEWIEKGKATAIQMGVNRVVESLEPGPPTFTGIDPAFGDAGKKGDRSAIVTFTVLPTLHRRILDVQVGRWPGHEMIGRIISTGSRYNSVVCIEENAGGKQFRDWARERSSGITIRSLNTTAKNKHDVRYGVQSIFLEIEDGLWLFPSDGGYDERGVPLPGKSPQGVQDLISGLLEYAPDRHVDDAVMAMWVGREYARKVGALRGMTTDDGGGGIAALIGAR